MRDTAAAAAAAAATDLHDTCLITASFLVLSNTSSSEKRTHTNTILVHRQAPPDHISPIYTTVERCTKRVRCATALLLAPTAIIAGIACSRDSFVKATATTRMLVLVLHECHVSVDVSGHRSA
eukprot:14601-Heterococcus_DN1.PRE.5